jgi:hypothetical protein
MQLLCYAWNFGQNVVCSSRAVVPICWLAQLTQNFLRSWIGSLGSLTGDMRDERPWGLAGSIVGTWLGQCVSHCMSLRHPTINDTQNTTTAASQLTCWIQSNSFVFCASLWRCPLEALLLLHCLLDSFSSVIAGVLSSIVVVGSRFSVIVRSSPPPLSSGVSPPSLPGSSPPPLSSRISSPSLSGSSPPLSSGLSSPLSGSPAPLSIGFSPSRHCQLQ